MEGVTTCGCGHHKAKPILVIVFGLVFLAGAFGWLSDRTVSIVWPIIVVLGGFMKLCGGSCKCCKMK